MLRQRYTRLTLVQQRLVSVLLGAFVILLGNSLLLLLFDRSTAAIYMTLVLLHVVLGTLLLAPVLVFLTLHIRKMPIPLNRPATGAGVFTASSAGILILSGFGLVVLGASYGDGWILWLHIASTVTTLIGFFAHVSLKRGVRYHFLEWGELWRGDPRQALKHPLNVTLLVGIFVSVVFLFGVWRDSRLPTFVHATQQDALEPGQAVLAHEGFLEDADLARSESCGQSGCHPDIYQQWSESVHHFSSFNNPFYRRTVELLVKDNGTAPVRWCASCHDPVVLFSGRMPVGGTIDMDHSTAQAGVTCLACHAMNGLRDVRGNGRYVMAIPDEYPFARSQGGPGKWIHNMLVRGKPEPHRRAMLKPMHQTAEFCGSCHKVGIPPEINAYRWKRGQDQYDSWHASGVSGNTVRSFYVPPSGRKCASCHMPLVPSDDEGNDGGFVRSHRFATANATLPMLNGHEEQLRLVRMTLQDSIVTLDLFRIEVNGKVYGPDKAMPVLEPRDQVRLTLVVRNRKVGHIFPAGTNDSNDIWVELRALDRIGEPVLMSGLIDATGYTDSTAHYFGAKLVDREGQLIAKRDVQDWVATVYANTIPPGAARTVHYRFTIPAGRSITALEATLNYRKFKLAYHQWVFRDRAPEDVPVQPITVIAAVERQARVAPETSWPIWERWNDYGIGLFLEGDTRGALAAFGQVARVALESPEGPINQARAYLREGQLDRAADVLDEAERRSAGYLKTAYFRSVLHKAQGEYDQALAELQRVVESYPEDRVVLLDMGRIHYLSDRYEAALNWFDKVLTIDPEDVGGLYNRMLTLGLLGRDEAFGHAQRLYQYHKADDSAMSVTAAFKQRHPMANREAQPIHEHGLQLVTKQTGASLSLISLAPAPPLAPRHSVLQAISVNQ